MDRTTALLYVGSAIVVLLIVQYIVKAMTQPAPVIVVERPSRGWWGGYGGGLPGWGPRYGPPSYPSHHLKPPAAPSQPAPPPPPSQPATPPA